MTTIRDQVLEIISQSDMPMTVGEVFAIISKKRKLVRTTLNPVMIEMVESGLLARDDSSPQRYMLPENKVFGVSPIINLFDRCIRQAGHQ